MDIAFVCYRTKFGINLITVTDLNFIECLTSRTPYCYLHQEVYVSIHVCLLVGLSGGLHKINKTDLHETWMKDGSQPRIDPH